MESIAARLLVSYSPVSCRHRPRPAGASSVIARRRCSVSFSNGSHFGLSRELAEGVKSLPGTFCDHDTFKCQARLNNRNSTSVTFHDYAPDEKDQSFYERLVHAWRILFPPKSKPVSNAEIAKQRLKMILISDRCAISDDAKRKIVDNVVGALSDFVEIESEEKVQLNVSADPDLGIVYSVIVPVRRVKPEYQDYNINLRNIEYGDAIGEMRTLDIRFEYPDSRDGQ